MNDLIFLSLEDWDQIWRRNQFVCATLARRHPEMKILFIGLSRNAARHLAKLRLKPLLTDPTYNLPEFPNITVTTPLRLGLESTEWGLRLNERLYRKHIRKIAARLGLRDPLLWINPHSAHHVAGGVPNSGVIYDITDDWTSLTQNELDTRRTIETDRLLCRRADAVIVCSEKLRELKMPLVKPERLHLIPNGVDAEHYAGVLRPGPVPAELAKLPRPIFGYTGTIHPDRVDVPLLAACAKALPNASFALVGPSFLRAEDQAVLAAAGNVHLLPAVAYAKIPEVMRAFDVSITPHRMTAFTESLNPIKLWEYLAAGKPIVSTDVAGFRDFRDHVRIARTAETFAAALKEAATEAGSPEGPLRAEARQTEARNHSWDRRVDLIEQVMNSVCGTKAAIPGDAAISSPVPT